MKDKQAIFAELEKLVNEDAQAELAKLRAFVDAIQDTAPDSVERIYYMSDPGEPSAEILMGNTIYWTVKMLAEIVGSKNWCIADGSETLVGDVETTIRNILIDAGVVDEESWEVARHPRAA